MRNRPGRPGKGRDRHGAGRGGRRSSDGGFILFAVLGAAALLSSFFVVASLMGRSDVDSAALSSMQLDEDALLQAGAEMAGYQLFVQSRSVAAVDGQQLRLDTGIIDLSVSAEARKVDLNGAPAALLAAAYRASGLAGSGGPEAADVFAQRVLAWRQPLNGAPQDDGAASQADAGGAANGRRFRSIDDLSWMGGGTAAQIAALRPYLTVFNPSGRLDVRSAPRALLASIAEIDAGLLEEILTLRQSDGDAESEALRERLSEQSNLFDFEAPAVFEVMITVRVRRAERARSAWAVMIAPLSDGVAYHIVDWRE